MKTFNLNIRLETRREMSVLPIDEPGNDSLYEVIGRARRADSHGVETSTLVLLRRLKDSLLEQAESDPFSIAPGDYHYTTGTEVETDSGRKFQVYWTPSQRLSCCRSMPIAFGEFLLSVALGESAEVTLRGDLFPDAGMGGSV